VLGPASGSIKGGEFLDQLSGSYLLKDSAAQSYCIKLFV
jgi:hypothetical protein